MKTLLTKLCIKLLTWLKENKKVYFDLDNDDNNDLQEWIDYLNKKIEEWKNAKK